MKNGLILIPFLFIFSFTQCVLFQPRVKPVKPIYLGNETEIEKKKMEQLENLAIEFREQIKKTEKEQEYARQKKIVNTAKLESIRQDLVFLNQLQTLVLMQPNEHPSTEITDRIATKNSSMGSETVYSQFIEMELKTLAGKIRMKRSELAKALAELEQIRAEIGVRNQKKMQIAPDSPEAIKLDDYRNNFNYHNEELAKAKSEFELNEAEKDKIRRQLEATGYKPEY